MEVQKNMGKVPSQTIRLKSDNSKSTTTFIIEPQNDGSEKTPQFADTIQISPKRVVKKQKVRRFIRKNKALAAVLILFPFLSTIIWAFVFKQPLKVIALPLAATLLTIVVAYTKNLHADAFFLIESMPAIVLFVQYIALRLKQKF